jgi:phage gpG-like protein
MATTEFSFKTIPFTNISHSKLVDNTLKNWNNYMMSKTRERLRTGIDVNGSPFKPRKLPDKVKTKSKRVLYETGDMFRSIQSTQTNDSIIIFSNLHYAKYHNEGRDYPTTKKQSVWMYHNLFGAPKDKSPFSYKRIHLPKREFLGINKQDEKKLADLATMTLKGMVENNGKA